MPPATPPPPPVSYHRQVAPIFAMHCNGCHGEAGRLSLRTYRGAMAGGNLGKVILAGDAERSLLIHFVDGRRGAAHRMPLGGRPLTAAQISTLRRWIDGGATEDTPPVARPRVIRAVQLPARITVRVAAAACLTLQAVDPATGATLWSDAATVKSPQEQNDSGTPGQPLHWDLHPEPGWPARVTLQLILEHNIDDPEPVQFTARPPL